MRGRLLGPQKKRLPLHVGFVGRPRCIPRHIGHSGLSVGSKSLGLSVGPTRKFLDVMCWRLFQYKFSSQAKGLIQGHLHWGGSCFEPHPNS